MGLFNKIYILLASCHHRIHNDQRLLEEGEEKFYLEEYHPFTFYNDISDVLDVRSHVWLLENDPITRVHLQHDVWCVRHFNRIRNLHQAIQTRARGSVLYCMRYCMYVQ